MYTESELEFHQNLLHDARTCYDLFRNYEKSDLQINMYLRYMFSDDDIEEILLRELEKAPYLYNGDFLRDMADDVKDALKYEGLGEIPCDLWYGC